MPDKMPIILFVSLIILIVILTGFAIITPDEPTQDKYSNYEYTETTIYKDNEGNVVDVETIKGNYIFDSYN